MPCYKPLEAWRSRTAGASGKLGVTFDRRESNGQKLELACGQCIGCRLEKSRQWAIRCVHENQTHEESCFITLTYNDDHLPPHGTLVKSHFQKFIKRFRKSIAPKKIRYYMCGEYGDTTNRPHYHALIFGHKFEKSMSLDTTAPLSEELYVSAELAKLWTCPKTKKPIGNHTVGNVTFETAAYTARYVLKKINGKKADEINEVGLKHYEVLDDNGQVHPIQPEYTAMSRRPGIGAHFFQEFATDIYPHDEVVIRGRAMRPPRYYDDQLEKYDSALLEQLKKNRVTEMKRHAANNTPERLAVREHVVKARTQQLKRKL